MTPEELVNSAEDFLRSCLVTTSSGGGVAEATDALVEKLTIHFSHRKTRAISVKGTTMNVPLPITLTASRAPTIWCVRVRVFVSGRAHCVCKYQSCMFSNVGLIVHAPVV